VALTWPRLPASADALFALDRLGAPGAVDALRAAVPLEQVAAAAGAAVAVTGVSLTWLRDWGPLFAWAGWLLFALWALARARRLLSAPAPPAGRAPRVPPESGYPGYATYRYGGYEAYPGHGSYGGGGAGGGPEGDADARSNGLWELLVLAGALAAGAVVALHLAGPPRPPEALPTWADVRQTLLGSDLPPEVVAYAALMLWWAGWAWLAGALALSLVVSAADALTAGAAWVRALAGVADRLSPPVVRALADRVVVATVAVHLAARVPAAGAAPPAVALAATVPAPEPGAATDQSRVDAPPAEKSAAPTAPAASAAETPAAPPAAAPAPSPVIVHEVRPGETLWRIALRYYGDGERWPAILEANRGRVMPTGERLTRPGLIRPGWPLLVPGPADGAPDGADAQGGESYAEYVVVPGDTLSGIAGRFLGDPARWRELYARNRGVAHLPDGRSLTDPDLIWPGLRLAFPSPVPVAEPAGGPASDGAPPAAVNGSPAEVVPEDVDAVAAPASVAAPGGTGSTAAAPEPIQHAPAAEALATAGPATDADPPREHAPEPGAVATRPAPGSPVGPPSAGNATAPASGPPTGDPARRDGPGQAASPGVPSVPATALAAAAAVGALGVSPFLVRRWVRSRPWARRRLEAGTTGGAAGPVAGDEAALGGGFAEAAFGPVLAHRLLGEEVEPAVVGAERVLEFLRSRGLPRVAVVTAAQGRPSGAPELRLVLAADSAAEEERLLALAPELGACLGGSGRAARTPDGDVRLDLSDLCSLDPFPSPAGVTQVPDGGEPPAYGPTPREDDVPSGGERPPPLLVAVGAPSRRHLLYANWRECGHVLVAGRSGAGVPTVLTGLVAALAARCHPRALRLITVGRPPPEGPAGSTCDSEDPERAGVLPGAVDAFPHLEGPRVPPDDREAVAGLAARLRDEVARRAAGGGGAGAAEDGAPGSPDLVVVLEDLAAPGALGALEALLEAVGPDGPRCGVSLLAATTRPEALPDAPLAGFATRLVLRTPDAATGRRLCDAADADLLDGGGHLLLSLAGRESVQLRGFRVAPEALDQLVRLMREAYPGPPAGSGSPAGGDPRAGDTHPPGRPEPAPAAVGVVADGAAVVAPGSGSGSAVPEDGGGPAGAPLPGTDGTTAPPADGRGDPGSGGGAAPAAGPPEAPADSDASGAARVFVRCFGALEVRAGGPEGRVLSSLGGDGHAHRSWEVLAFLAAQPAGAVATDRVLATLWPDAAPADAANAMGAAVSRLRSRLARQVPGLPGRLVVRDRAGGSRLDPAAVATDVAAFVRACAAAREAARAGRPEEAAAGYEAARALYRGHLLAAPGYPWAYDPGEDGVSLDEQYRRLHREATTALAGLYEEDGGPARAAPLYEELARAEPTDAAAGQRLLRAYHRLGDRAALARAFRDLATWARAALGDDEDVDGEDEEAGAADPAGATEFLDPETVQLYETLRADLERRAAAGGAGGREAGDRAPGDRGGGGARAAGATPRPSAEAAGETVRAA
jgi:nucleoid-associated protein YgaU/DNA-binding SARP family transcriptional activator